MSLWTVLAIALIAYVLGVLHRHICRIYDETPEVMAFIFGAIAVVTLTVRITLYFATP